MTKRKRIDNLCMVNNKFKDQKLDYKYNNPVEVGFVDYSGGSGYSSARYYSGRTEIMYVYFF